MSGPGGSSGKALGYGLDGLGSIPSVGGVEIFLRSFVSRLVLRSTQPPIKWVPWAFLGVGLATLPLPSAVAVYMWTLASTSPWAFLACNVDTFTFIFTWYFTPQLYKCGLRGDRDFRNSELAKALRNGYLTSGVNYGELQRALLAKSTLITFTLMSLRSFQNF